MNGAAATAVELTAIVAMVTAVAALINAVWQGIKTRTDLARAQRDITATKRHTTVVAHEVGSNGGSSLRDAIDRIERKLDERERRLLDIDERRGREADRTHAEIFHRLDKLERSRRST